MASRPHTRTSNVLRLPPLLDGSRPNTPSSVFITETVIQDEFKKAGMIGFFFLFVMKFAKYFLNRSISDSTFRTKKYFRGC